MNPGQQIAQRTLVVSMMQIELFGCTCAGKTTLAQKVLETCQEQGINLLMGDDYVLKLGWLNWMKGSLARKLSMQLVSLIACLATWRSNLELYVLMIRIILRLPIARRERLGLVRNCLVRIGTYEIIRHRGTDRQPVLVDGGTLQAAHHLFVHVSTQVSIRDLLAFVKLVPLPRAGVHVIGSRPVLLQRLMERRHKRVPDRSYDHAELFVKRASEVFDKLAEQAVLEGRLRSLDSSHRIYVAYEDCRDPLLAAVLEVIDRLLAGQLPVARFH
jgi:hypothetical protein